MKKVVNVNKISTLWFTYFAEHSIGDNDKLSDIPYLTFDNEDQAIGAAQALLIMSKGVYYTCVIKSTKYIGDEELYSDIVWEAEAEDGDEYQMCDSKNKSYS